MEQKAYLLKQMEEKKQKKAMIRAQDMFYDKQRVAVMAQTNKNHQEFNMRNISKAMEQLDANEELHR